MKVAEDFQLLRLDGSHLQALVDLDQICYGGLWGLQGYREELERTHSTVLGCFVKTYLCGFGILWQVMEEAHIISLAVHPQYRRRGIGTKLLCALLDAAVEQGCEWATLEVKASNRAAQHLYEHHGFRLLGRRHHYYADTGEDALIYWKKNLRDR